MTDSLTLEPPPTRKGVIARTLAMQAERGFARAHSRLESDAGNAAARPHRPAGMEGYAIDGPIGRAAEVGPRATVVPCPVQSVRSRHHDVARHAGDDCGAIDRAAERRTGHERPLFAAIAGHRRHAVAAVVSPEEAATQSHAVLLVAERQCGDAGGFAAHDRRCHHGPPTSLIVGAIDSRMGLRSEPRPRTAP